ncbi:isoprenylcysteine carboxylmethyltransferase family protein [candidate division KSB1 bacterium]|nr:isoprenylcysteine carboxylmethyltransferase family protein [candidate division KSB1 bacterium]
MNLESTFRFLFVAIFVAALSISIYHRHKARQRGGQIARSEESALMIFFRVLIALPLYAAMLLYMINPNWMSWARFDVPAWLRWCALVLAATMLPLLLWLFRSIGRNISETVLTKSEQSLVTHGPYRWVRHPLYSAGAFGFFALGIVAANWFITGMMLLVIFMLPLLVEKEEAQLLAKFGQSYRAYMLRTGRFLPKLNFMRTRSATV